MSLPFSIDQFMGVFVAYNIAAWPAQMLLYGVGVLVVVNQFAGGPAATRRTLFLLALLWLWMGLVYHFMFFSLINPAAFVFALLFLIQAGLFAAWRGDAGDAAAHQPGPVQRWTGGVLVAYGLLGYPALGMLLGHRYPQAPTFGVPCPTTITTLGLLLWLPRPSFRLAAIPLAWSVIGTTAALGIGMYEDVGLGLAAIAFVAVAFTGRLHRGITPRRHPVLAVLGRH